ncbi:MAG: DNA-binding protein WhiA [Thermovirgaceae bacterium]|jgi:hypothetical protein|nr:DNA-binding protein WhiA [Synergistales bacterium]MDI9392009.1 DNA-binding protein WhiA [Synergistota bacterium]HRW88194.1 DNA-binding protein WhiA [Thermovirgaceae bacterium]MDD3829424.1 DNA-binding protein WhiA [Synergistales bacterium]MDD4022984.1 DNA-binding protein WhiA [Synergistales bacterium]
MEKLREVIWDDWSSVLVDDRVKASVEIGGIISGLSGGERRMEAVFSSSRFFVFRKLKRLWEVSDWGRPGETAPNLVIPSGMRGKVSLWLDQSMVHEKMSLYGDPKRNRANTWHWLRGIFGSCGSLFLPRTGYYMVFRTSKAWGRDPSERLGQLLAMNDISFRRRTRYGFSETVIRDQSSIVGMLSNMQMFRTSLLLEEKAMLRSMKERANKVVNCDASNIRKSLETAKRQLETAEELIVTGKIRMLSEAFRELVYARMENPSATLRELGQVLSKPVSKSTVEYRWRKIEHLAGISSE